MTARVLGLRSDEQADEAREQRRFRYLPGLDGLRGIGLIVVMLYHADVMGDGALFTLEMFFCLSGFLIASLFLVEKHNTDRISLKRFWHRRFRRLGPALVPMFAIVALYATWSASPFELNRIRGDGIATGLYVSNWWFIISGVSYFEAFAAPSPLRHTWSLSIEEQFYLIVAVAFFFMMRRWGPDKRWYPWVIGGLAVLSALWMAFLARMSDLMAQGLWPLGIDPASMSDWMRTLFNFRAGNDPSRVYYGTDTRLQGSLVGVAMAFIVARLDLSRISQRTYEILAFIGTAGLMVMFFGITGKGLTWIYYGAFFAADLFTALAIVGMMGPRPTFTGRLLAWRPLVFCGVLSYSVYVLHWPIFVWLDAQSTIRLDGWAMVALKFALSFGLAYLSFRFYENRIRANGLPTFRKRVAMIVVCVTVAATFLVATTVGARSGEEAIEFQPTDDGRTPVLFAGDSMPHTMLLHIGGARADEAVGMAVYPATILGCGMMPGDAYVAGRLNPRPPMCEEWLDLWRNQVERVNPAVTVLLDWGWDVYDRRVTEPDGTTRDVAPGTQEWEDLHVATVQQGIDILTSQGGKVVLLNMPCIDDRGEQARLANPESAEDHRVHAINRSLQRVARDNPATVVLADLNGLLCDGEFYRYQINGVTMSPDGIHPTPEGSLVIWNWLYPQLYAAIGIPPEQIPR